MSLIYAFLSKRRTSLRIKLLLTFIVYFIVMKNVHEPHSFVLIPLFILVLAENFSIKRLWMYRLIWILPLTFAVFNVPITRFFYGFTLNENFLYFLTLPEPIKAILLGAIMIAFYITLWTSLVNLTKE
ncbi:hypothetical protein AKJ43_03740 [candidate division MSBL1 archaeon SCGC-AAA261D19]|uniref:Uncharacterized protein n=1 Tax=candidate division MSBL1 archaeon SCGC-AAA261D19 TaxID=1698273 RepID=A0A133V3N2_9EURY|nr:hypothetical protein AKJ43_03740 [candidate division MSBL1 archaeon SCGC-AAA261D19]